MTDAIDAARWRFTMRAVTDEHGPEARALNACSPNDGTAFDQVAFEAIVDAAMALVAGQS